MEGVSWYDLVGFAGVALIIGAYLGLQSGRVSAEALGYSAANALGAALVLVSLAFDFNAAAAVVEGFWLAISLYGVGRRFGGRTQSPAGRERAPASEESPPKARQPEGRHGPPPAGTSPAARTQPPPAARNQAPPAARTETPPAARRQPSEGRAH